MLIESDGHIIIVQWQPSCPKYMEYLLCILINSHSLKLDTYYNLNSIAIVDIQYITYGSIDIEY